MRFLPYFLAALVLAIYFAWLIAEMATHANGGASVPEATFGAAFLGILSAAAAFVHQRRRR